MEEEKLQILLAITKEEVQKLLPISDEEIARAQSIVKKEIKDLREKSIRSKTDCSSRNSFITYFEHLERLLKMEKNIIYYHIFLKRIILSKKFLNTNIPMEYFKAIIEKLGFNKHPSYRTFTKQREARTVAMAFNYPKWSPIMDTIKVYRRKNQSDYKFDCDCATSAVVATVNGVTTKTEFYQAVVKGKTHLIEIKTEESKTAEQKPQQSFEFNFDDFMKGVEYNPTNEYYYLTTDCWETQEPPEYKQFDY